jgi:DNA-binding SARP family transcriptional activator
VSRARSDHAAPPTSLEKPRVLLELLGPIRVVVGRAPFVVDTRKASAILAVLAVEGSQRRERLTNLLWPDRDSSHAAGAFWRTLSVLNTALGPGVLVPDRREISLVPGAVDVDVGRFNAWVTSTATHEHASSAVCSACREPLEAAVALHRGPFLDGFAVREAPEFDDWQMSWTERLQRELCRALDRLTRIELDAGRLDVALEHTERWLTCEPLNEQVHVRLMFLHARRGERSQAIQRYRDCVAVLDRELGVRPLERTNQLYRAVLEGKSDPLQTPGLHPVTPAPPSPARKQAVETQTLVGRGPELDDAEQQLDQETVLAIRGEAGIGKIRFVEELEARLHRRGAVVLVGRCQPDERSLSFGPIMDLIRAGMALPGAADRLAGLNRSWVVEASRLVPELANHPAPTGRSDLPEVQTRLLDGLAHVVASILADRQLRVVLLEDLHNADEATLNLVTYLGHRLEEPQLALVLTYRDDELRRARSNDGSLSNPTDTCASSGGWTTDRSSPTSVPRWGTAPISPR